MDINIVNNTPYQFEVQGQNDTARSQTHHGRCVGAGATVELELRPKSGAFGIECGIEGILQFFNPEVVVEVHYDFPAVGSDLFRGIASQERLVLVNTLHSSKSGKDNAHQLRLMLTLPAHPASPQVQTESPTPSKMHMTFSSSDGLLAMQVNHNISGAGMMPTGPHTAQSSEWFTVWKQKLFEACGVAILFTDSYRARFYEGPLIQEAWAIIEKTKQSPNFKIYVLDPSTQHHSGYHNASDVLANLKAGTQLMGDVKEWQSFVAPFFF